MNIQQIMKQAQAMQKKMEEMQKQLATKEEEGQAGGGLVKIVVNGKSEMKKIDIDRELLKPTEKDMLQDLIVAAYNDAKSKLDGDLNSAMSGFAGELGLPPGFKLPS
jgi:DNA-binding YbaB/EbfC family protein